jgi:hypothetical protein
MKHIIYITTLLLCLNCFGIRSNDGVEKDVQETIDKIKIISIDFDILTGRDIPCHNFEAPSKGECFAHEITDTTEISKLTEIALNLIPIDSTDYNGVDTRAKMLFYSKGEIKESVCVGKFTIQKGDNFYKTPQGLVAYITQLNNTGAVR